MTVNVKMDSTTHALLEDSDFKTKMLDLIYPVGSVYQSLTSTYDGAEVCPLAKYGGKWALVDIAWYCTDSSKRYAINAYGGATDSAYIRLSTDGVGHNARFVLKPYVYYSASNKLGYIATWVRTA